MSSNHSTKRKTVDDGGNFVNSASCDDTTIGVLKEHLEEAEKDTRALVSALANLGFSHTTQSSPKHMKTLSEEDYEGVVTRVCKVESILQSLKLSICSLQAQKSFTNTKADHNIDRANEQLKLANENFTKEMKRMERDFNRLRSELGDLHVAKAKSDDDVRRLTDALDFATLSRSDFANKADELKVSRQKMCKRITELRNEQAREASIRETLEDSHEILLSRIQDMEIVVEQDREQVRQLSSECTTLKKQCVKSKDDANREHALRTQAEELIIALKSESDTMLSKLSLLEHEKTELTKVVNHWRKEHSGFQHTVENQVKLTEELQLVNRQLEVENKHLHEALHTSATENTNLTSEYSSKIAETEHRYEGGLLDAQEHTNKVLVELDKERNIVLQLQQRINELNAELRNTEENRKILKHAQKAEMNHRDCTIEQLQREKSVLEGECENMVKDKESLIDEVSETVDSMRREKVAYEQLIAQLKVELKGALESRNQMEREAVRLLDKVGTLEKNQELVRTMEQSLNEAIESKNRLAYEKGQLQSELENQQRSVEQMSQIQSELQQLKKTNYALETQLTKTNRELTQLKIDLQRTEVKVKQTQEKSGDKEAELARTVQSKSDELKQKIRDVSRLEAGEERDRNKLEAVYTGLHEAKAENSKLTSNLNTIMSSHNQLQQALEESQLELGRKDSQINSLRREKSLNDGTLLDLQQEVDDLRSKMMTLATMEATELPLKLQQTRSENVELNRTLDTVMQANSELQAIVDKLTNSIDDRDRELKNITEKWHTDLDRHEAEIAMYHEKFEAVTNQQKTELELNSKKTQKINSELKKIVGESQNKCTQLSHSNVELRQKVGELDQELVKLREKIRSQKSLLDHFHRNRKNTEQSTSKMKELNDELERMERQKNEYMGRNKDQAKAVSKFVKQMASLEGELRELAQVNNETGELCKKQDQLLSVERRRRLEAERRCRELEDACQEMKNTQQDTEAKLTDINNESIQVSQSLQDAHDWFSKKFDSLQQELTKSRSDQQDFDRDLDNQRQTLERERVEAFKKTQQAKEMIRASRDKMKKLSGYLSHLQD